MMTVARATVSNMPEHSAGLLLYRFAPTLEVWLGHMGGPFWSRKDAAAWSIPKGLVEAGEDVLSAALREFNEEIGMPAPDADYRPLVELRLSSGKRVSVLAGAATSVVSFVESNLFELEWPPRSGRMQSFAEIDRAEWFDLETARLKIVKGQLPAIDALQAETANETESM